MRKARDPDAIRAAMARRDLTHSELAAVARCAKGMVTKTLDGRPINDELAVRFARVLRGRVDDLFVGVASSDRQAIDKQQDVA